MKELDDRIRHALEGIESNSGGAFDRIGEMFLRRSRSLMIIGWVKCFFFIAIAAAAALMFFRSTDPKAASGWAAIFVVMSLSLGTMFTIYWLELFRNSMLRELKRLELRLTEPRPDQQG